MANFNISDLSFDDDFEQLTKEELELINIYGGAAGAGSVSAGRYSQRGDVVEETAVSATVATSDRRPFKIDLSYSFKPRLSATAGVSFR